MIKLTALCALLLMSLPPAIAQDGVDAAPSKIVALEKAWNQAFKFRDKRALAEILHDSTILVDDDGTLESRPAFLASVDAAPPSDVQQAYPESISVTVFGDVAVATGVFRSTGIEKGKAYIKRIRFVDTWVRKGASWVCIAASATPMLH